MRFPSESEWNLREIEAENSKRASRLREALNTDQFVKRAISQLENAISSESFRLGVDSVSNRGEDCRLLLQFQVDQNFYDLFLNSPIGYRAHFWANPKLGLQLDEEIADLALQTLLRTLSAEAEARKIYIPPSRKEAHRDDGPTTVTRTFVEQSLTPRVGKIWICEDAIRSDVGPMQFIAQAGLVPTGGSRPPSLIIPRWRKKEDGERAPYPEPEYAWLEIKGGFVHTDGTAFLIKCAEKRAKEIYEDGWT